MITIAFFNNKGGVGKTALVSHLAWMFAEQGVPTLAVDLDPQASLSEWMLGEGPFDGLVHMDHTVLADTRSGGPSQGTVAVAPGLHLMVGDLRLVDLEEGLDTAWAGVARRDVTSIERTRVFRRVVAAAAHGVGARLVLIDLAPNFGPIARAAVVTADRFVVPLARERFGFLELSLLGPRLRSWRSTWRAAIGTEGVNPDGELRALGYVMVDGGGRPEWEADERLSRAERDWRRYGLGEGNRAGSGDSLLGVVRRYPSLWSMSSGVRKPMFLLRSADGARGAHVDAVRACYDEFLALARRIAQGVGIALPSRVAP